MAEHFLFRGGVHPHDFKELTAACPIQDAPLLETYVVPLQQHIGAPPKALVKKGDVVLKGQLLAEPGGFVSAAIHCPTSGTVKAEEEVLGPTGRKGPALVIESDGEDTPAEPLPPIADWETADPSALRDRVSQAGLVGMGGAAFPTFVKLSPPPNKPVDILIVNGVECEPFLTADDRLMLEQVEKVLIGTRIAARILGVKRMVIGIEENKPEAIKVVRAACEGTDVEVLSLRVRYPQGAEKQLIYAATERKVPAPGLPSDIGAVVQNVGTMVALAEAVVEGKPLYERVTTITGTPLVSPGNWRLRVGTSYADALKLAGGVKCDTGKILSGGPMMGFAVYSLEIPVMKNTSGITLLGMDELSQFTSGPCIRCGRCVDACPMSLRPGMLSVMIESCAFEQAEGAHVEHCIECGCCSYVCPSSRPLVQHLRRGKAEAVARRRAAEGK